MEKLTYLVQFYEVKGYEDWENDDNAYDRDDLGLTSGSSSIGGSSELDDTSLGTSTLENAVRRHPDKALRALAMKLGLVYRDVTRCMEEIEHRQFLQDIVAAKRRSPQQDSGRQAKIARRTAAYSPPQHSSSFLRHLVMTASQEMRERMEKSKGSESERVYWEEPDAIDGQTRLLAALARGDVSLQVVENRSGSGRSAPKHLAGEQSAAEEPTVEEPIAVPWEDGSTVPITVSSRKLSEKRSSQASERKGRVTPAKSSGTGRSSASEE